MAYLGIDYGSGTTNVNHATGIRYGVISQHTVGQAWYDDAEPDYGKPTCPKCEAQNISPLTELTDDIDASGFEQYRHGCADYVCEHCEHTLDSQDCFGDEPQGWNYSGEGYELTDCLDSNIFVLASPYYTFAQFCSPCVPGAGDLDSPMDDGAKTYCLGHEWFEDGKAPYPVYSVKTDKLIED